MARSRILALLSTAVAVPAAVYLFNVATVGRPVSQALAADLRNDGFTLRAHLGSYVRPGVLVLDLVAVEEAAPLDLLRGLFQAAEVFHERDRTFDRVEMARGGETVFVLEGDDFATLGSEFAFGQNPVYMIRTLPEKLYRPDGTRAYGTWTGGLLGVLGQQMNDTNDAARRWVSGGDAAESGSELY